MNFALSRDDPRTGLQKDAIQLGLPSQIQSFPFVIISFSSYISLPLLPLHKYFPQKAQLAHSVLLRHDRAEEPTRR